MKKHSCGAILYTIYNNKIYIVLGMEKGQWFPFKGSREKNETNEMAAIREIYEETCGVVKIKNIELKCHYSTKRKHYHIGLIQIPSNIIEKFYLNKDRILNNTKCVKNNKAYLEKSDIKMFPLNKIFTYDLHEVTIKPIKYFYTYLKSMENKLNYKNRDIFQNSPYLFAMPKKILKKIPNTITQSQIMPEYIPILNI